MLSKGFRQLSLSEALSSQDAALAEALWVLTVCVCLGVGGSLRLYQNKFCSALNCTENGPENSTEVAFTVHLFDDQRYHFASKCCQEEACNGTHNGLYRAQQSVLGHTSILNPCFFAWSGGGCLKSRHFCTQLDNVSIRLIAITQETWEMLNQLRSHPFASVKTGLSWAIPVASKANAR